MTLRLMQCALIAVVAACSAAPTGGAPTAGERPFSVSEVATFDQPWAMDFLPGSGVPLTSGARYGERREAVAGRNDHRR